MVAAVPEKLLEGGGIVAAHPAGLDVGQAVKAYLRAVFLQQTELDYVELQFAHGTDYFAVAGLLGEKLRHTFVGELLQALFELFGLEGVFIFDHPKQFGRKSGDALEVKAVALGERIAYFEVAGIVQAHHIAGVGEVDIVAFVGLKHDGCAKPELFPQAWMVVKGIAFKYPRTHPHKGNAVAVVGVEISVYFKHKATQLGIGGLYGAFGGFAAARCWRYFDEGVEQLLHPEVVECRAKKHWCNVAILVSLDAELGMELGELGFFAQLSGVAFAQQAVELAVVEVFEGFHIVGDAGFVGREEVELFPVQIVHALKGGAFADGPGEGRGVYAQLLVELVEQVERVLPLAVHFVDEHNHGRIPHPAHRHQLFGLLFHTFGGIYHQNHRVDGGEGAVGVFGEVFVAGGVEYVHTAAAVFEAHHGGRYRDTPLLFYLHEVGGCRLFDLIAFHRSGRLYGATEEQKLLGEGGFSGVGVGDDGKSTAT